MSGLGGAVVRMSPSVIGRPKKLSGNPNARIVALC